MIYWLSGSYCGNNIEDDGARFVDDSLDSFPDFDGTSLAETWVQPPLELTEGKVFDVVSYVEPSAIVFNEKAKMKLLPFIGNEVEFLPVTFRNMNLYVVNVVNMVDCLDRERSELYYRDDGKTVRAVRYYVFRDCIPNNTYLFKIPESKSATILCTDSFKNLVESTGITGAKCLPVI